MRKGEHVDMRVKPWEVVLLTIATMLGAIAPIAFGVERQSMTGAVLAFTPLVVVFIILLIIADLD